MTLGPLNLLVVKGGSGGVETGTITGVINGDYARIIMRSEL